VSEDDDPVDLVLSVGELDQVVVTLREFLHAPGALRAVALVETEAGAAGSAVVDCGRLAPIEVDFGDRIVHLPHAVALSPAAPPLPHLPPLPPFEVDAAEGRVAGPMGAVERIAEAVSDLAAALGGRSVALAQWPSDDPGAPLGVSARADGSEPLVLSIGEEEFEMDPGWPGR
jgi:hypothetical protein